MNLGDPDGSEGYPSAVLGLVALSTASLIIPVTLIAMGWTTSATARHFVARNSVPFRPDDPAWGTIRAALENADIDPERVTARKYFSRDNRPRVVNVTYSVGFYRSRFSGWAWRRQRRVAIAGGLIGLSIAVLDSQTGLLTSAYNSKWADRLAVVLLVVMAPFFAYYGSVLYRRNFRTPSFELALPTVWLSMMRRYPDRARVLLDHEISHIRHGDAATRRRTETWITWARMWSFVGSGLVFALPIGDGAHFLALLVVAVAAQFGLRAIRRQYVLLQELRADTEAATDELSRQRLVELLTRLAASSTDESTRARQASLDSRFEFPLRRFYLGPGLVLFGFAVPIVVASMAVLSGLVAIESSFGE